MKNMIKLPAIVLGLMLLLTGTTQKVMAQGDDVSLQSFYDELSPYGTWIQDPQYGYVWRPDVEQSDFRPYYSNGRWAMTEYGNTWVSNYDWGWAPFHYGRWVYNRYGQWVWIPDTTWGPAWVSWRSGGGYYGWAPMGPGMNININFDIPSLWWVFVPQRNIYYDSFPRYYSRRNNVYINNTTIINNTYINNRHTYYSGPRADDIRRATGRDVRVYNVNNTGRPSRSSINGDNLNIYSPRPSRGSSNVNAAPRTAIRGEGYTSPRPDRNGSTVGNNNNTSTGRPSRDNNNNGITDRGTTGGTYSREGRPNSNGTTPNYNMNRPNRTDRGNVGTITQPDRGTNPSGGSTTTPARDPRLERPSRTPQPQAQPQPQQQTAPQQRPERSYEAPRQQQQQQQPRQEQPRMERPQRQEQPRQAPVQQSRPERVQPSSAPVQRSEGGSRSEGRSSGGGRPSRSGR